MLNCPATILYFIKNFQMSSDFIYMESFHTLTIKMTHFYFSSLFKNAKYKRFENELQASSATGELQFYMVILMNLLQTDELIAVLNYLTYFANIIYICKIVTQRIQIVN